MPKIDKTSSVARIPKKIYSLFELQTLDKEIEGYRYEKTLSNGDRVSLFDFDKYHRDQGSMSTNGVIINYDGFGDPIMPIKYEVVEEKLRQWKEWRGRREFGQKKRLEGLDKVAEQMRVKEINIDDIPL